MKNEKVMKRNQKCREYYYKNREERLEYAREYREKLSNKLVHCEICDKVFKYLSLSRHLNSQEHEYNIHIRKNGNNIVR